MLHVAILLCEFASTSLLYKIIMAENDAPQTTQDKTPDTGSQQNTGIENSAYSEVNQSRTEQTSFLSGQNNQLGNSSTDLQNNGTLPSLGIDRGSQGGDGSKLQDNQASASLQGQANDLKGGQQQTNQAQGDSSVGKANGVAAKDAMLNGFELTDSAAKPKEPAKAESPANDGEKPKGDSVRIDRSQFDEQLKDPKVMAAFAGRLEKEVGGQGAAAHVAFAEEVMNRAASRGQTIMQALSGSYYPKNAPHPGSSSNPAFHAAITKAWKEGTDTTQGATGNGNAGFGPGGHETKTIGKEKFGMEEVDIAKGWKEKYEKLKRR